MDSYFVYYGADIWNAYNGNIIHIYGTGKKLFTERSSLKSTAMPRTSIPATGKG